MEKTENNCQCVKIISIDITFFKGLAVYVRILLYIGKRLHCQGSTAHFANSAHA